MNHPSNEPWRGQGPPPTPDGGQVQHNRPFGSFGAPAPQQHPSVLPPPPPYHHQHQPQHSGNHNLSIADLTQGPPQQHHQYNTQPPPTQGPSLASMSQHPLSHHSPPFMNRERELREIREREMREQEQRDREIQQRRHQEDMMLREREAREREMLHREQQLQGHTGGMPIHQPVPSKVQNTIHGPNGLLANGGAGPIRQNAPGFGMHAQISEPPRQSTFGHQAAGPPQAQPGPPIFGGPSPMTGHAQLPHGQQPILNDALSYLDQVKVRFSDQPEVYNRFLDIMKDFKSQAIDTPGVIDRVSNLFNGHPTLIQGFNTFLPPGYRIECGTEENPDAIRVTTPSGTMTQSLQSKSRSQFDVIGLNTSAQPQVDGFDGRRTWNQIGQQSSPGTRSVTVGGFDQSIVDREAEAAIHQQEQRGVSALQGAISTATNGVTRPPLVVSPSPGQQSGFAQASGLFGTTSDPKASRGPVEFNHAISYVNKIKNRFAQQPEIYKQFLEILQTYQRESKPIGDVYSQVTQLFRDAPDLLEDFKQFLPETAAHAKAQASARAAAAEEMLIPTSNVRGGFGPEQVPQVQTPRPAAKMPPMGQFDPPSTSKENKKRRAPVLMAPLTQPSLDASTQSRGPMVQVGNANKRQKITNQRPVQPDGPIASPTLIPALPEPLPSLPPIHTPVDEFAFFDRVKKHINNRSSYTEFIKLVNLFTQDLIDKYVLFDRVGAFLGGNPDLMAFFSGFLCLEEQEHLVDPSVRPDPGRVNLSHCRALGPSYRHLPKRDQNKPCKGRDGMCYEVLNDVWASHPTWASEDSGFVAHRKNQYEEALHRIEEERHDYDFHIESCQRTIQLMEPIVQQINVMSDADRAVFQLAPGLGGASEAIPKRIIMKVYGREAGAKVMHDMFVRPVAVLPLLLRRLKQKLEEWKQVQREWEKVWREQINKQFWKSLDHQGINAKNLDKKNFQQKTLVGEIQAKYEEQKKRRLGKEPSVPKHQLEYTFASPEVILDATRLVLAGLEADRNNYNSGDQTKIRNFFLDFIPRFFSMEKQLFDNLLLAGSDVGRPDEHADEERVGEARSAPKSKSKLKKQALLYRNVLDRSRDDSVVSASKESTPLPAEASDTETPADQIADVLTLDEPASTWIKLNPHHQNSTKLFTLDEAYPHTTFNFWANANPYHFFRLFEMLYSRLLAVKENEAPVHDAVFRHQGEGKGPKPASELGMIDRSPEDYFMKVGKDADYYGQIFQMCEEVITGLLEVSHLEDTLRRYYNRSGWQLYTIDKLVAAVIRSMWAILSSDSKDKSLDITNLFLRDRDRPDTTRAQEMQYRKQVEKFSKEGEVFRISFTPSNGNCTVRLFPSEESTFDNDALSDEARWNYYLSSYAITYATEGVDQTKLSHPFLRRSIPEQKIHVEAAYEEVYGSLYHHDDQTASISPDTYKMRMEGEWVFYRFVAPKKKYTTGQIEESESFVEKFVRNVAWMKDQRAEDVEQRKAAWEKGVKEGMSGIEDKATGEGSLPGLG